MSWLIVKVYTFPRVVKILVSESPYLIKFDVMKVGRKNTVVPRFSDGLLYSLYLYTGGANLETRA